MSFSANTKNELAHIALDKKCCMLAETAAFIRMCGTIKLMGGGKMSASLITENAAAARLFLQMVKNYFGAKLELQVVRSSVLNRGNLYELTIPSTENAEQILRETGILGVREGCNYITDGVVADLVKKKCCKKAYLRGVFLGAGTISDPEKSYHMEIVCNSEYLGNDIRKLINSFGLRSKMVQRKKNYVVYIKEGDQLIDFLNIVGAYGQLLDFENVRIVKEMRNKTNRIVNCESANLDKTINAAGRQMENIRLIEEKRGLHSLSDKLLEVAELRLANPGASLAELSELLDPPVGKSGLNHRFKKIDEIAEKLRNS